eukprot:13525140-Heterocapsa_arctica.AAC.1
MAHGRRAPLGPPATAALGQAARAPRRSSHLRENAGLHGLERFQLATPSSTSSATTTAWCGRRCTTSCRPSSDCCRCWNRAGTYRGQRSSRRPTHRWTERAAASATWRAAKWPAWAECPSSQ